MTYFKNIQAAISTSAAGLKLSLAHFFQVFTKKREQDITALDYFHEEKGTVTLQFPRESIPVPDHGRYKLHNEIEDCIVCDKCARVCPINCIDIVHIRSPEAFGETSDGTPLRIYAETFDIDMSKCMFCGLCTTVCPTECLTMTSEFDYSTYDIRDHLFPFGNMTDKQVIEKKAEWEKHQAQKMVSTRPALGEAAKPKPVMGGKPILKPKPVFEPRVLPKKDIKSEENIKGPETPKSETDD